LCKQIGTTNKIYQNLLVYQFFNIFAAFYDEEVIVAYPQGPDLSIDFDFRARPWYWQAVDEKNANKTVILSNPYLS
jgi:hypothetical protein